MVDILYILKDKLLPVKGVPRKAEIIQKNRTEHGPTYSFMLPYIGFWSTYQIGHLYLAPPTASCYRIWSFGPPTKKVTCQIPAVSEQFPSLT